MRKTFRTRAGAAALVALIGLAAACGDGDETEAAAGERPAPTEAPSEEANSRFCDAIVALDATPPPNGPDADPSEYLNALKPIAADLKAAAPTTVAGAAASLDEIVNGPIGEQGPDVEGLFVASGTLHTAVADECDFATIAVQGIDYGFEGVPAEVKAGVTNFSFENVSNREMHEMVIVKKREGVTEPIEELVKMGPAAFEKVEVVQVTFAEPGTTGGVVVDVAEGEYGMICFIPVGGAEGAPPHAAHGMVTSFTVTA